MNNIIFVGKHLLTRNVSLHKHANWELIYCTSATGKLLFEEDELPYREGDVVIVPPDLPHENVSEEGFTNIHMNVEDATLTFTQPTVIRDDANQSLLHLFADAHYLYCGDPELQAALLSSYGNLIVRRLSLMQKTSAKNPAVAEIEQSIVENYADPAYKLDEVLRSMPYCYDYLCRLFRQVTHTTPHKYLTNLRLQAAADILCSGRNGSISEIAQTCGFRDPLYFSRLFKRKYQVSPSAYPQAVCAKQENEDSDSQKIIVPE